jgi:hypothetical protein
VSSRSAGCCRLHRQHITTAWHQADPAKASARHQRDTELRPEIKRVWDENYQVYGVRKAWHQLKREGFTLARCTVERLMKQIGIRGAVRGKVVKTTVPDTSAPCPRDKVNRVFRAPAPNLRGVSDFTYVSTWQGVRHGPRTDGGLMPNSMLPSSSTRLQIASSAGGSHGRPRQTLFSMLLNRPCMIGGRSRKAAWCTTRTAAGNIYPFAIPSVWPKLASSHRSAAWETPMTTPSRRR